MKKFLLGIIVLLSFLSLPVYAEEKYALYQLIPINKHATVETDHFIYRDFYYNDNEMQRESLHNNHIIFAEIKNKSTEELPVTITVGFFDKDKKNIGELNYCGTKEDITFAAREIGPDVSVPYSMVVTRTDLIDKKDLKDIVYIAVLGENRTCSIGKATENSGRTVEEIKEGNPTNKNSLNIDSQTMNFLYGVGGGILLLILFLWFRSVSTSGMTRDEVIREEYKLKHQQNLQNRGQQLTPPSVENTQTNLEPQQPVEEAKPTQEESLIEEAPKEEQENNDLMNLFK